MSTFVLPGGRQLAFAEFGDPAGPLVLHHHGAPGSRLEPGGLAAGLAETGARVVSVDRPGYGGSSPAPRRDLASWAEDAAALADHLGTEAFAVTGYSSGGPYALACAALLGRRVLAAGVLSGVSDFGWAGAREGYLASELEIMAQDGEAGAIAWCERRYGPDGAGLRAGGDTVALTAADKALLSDRSMVRAHRATMAEALRQGVLGYAQDVAVQAAPWPFDPAAIAVPVHVWHGLADTIVPVAHARHTASAVAGAREPVELRVFEEQGHLSMLPELPRLIAECLRSAGSAAGSAVG